MSVRGMILAPLVSILIGYAVNNFPTSIITETTFYKEDQYGLRSAVQHAGEHIQDCITGLTGRAYSVRDAVLYKVTGTSPPVVKTGTDGKEKIWNGEKKKKSKRDKQRDKNGASGMVTRLFTAEELKEYDGSSEKLPVYLALLGQVFDVTKGRQHYGPGGGYAFFAGKDATRAYVSGDFSPAGLIDDISDLSWQDYIGLEEWLQFYRKDYRQVGLLVGRYYNEDGKETVYWNQWQRWLGEARQQKLREDGDRQIFPPCNSDWRENVGGRVYCSRRSGGVSRSWVGVPRQHFSKGKKRCACVRDRGRPSYGADPGTDRGDLDHPQLKEYPGCPQYAEECSIQK